MKVAAKISREWRDRMAIILILLIGAAGWFFYDGFISYPKYNVKASEYAKLAEVYKADDALLQEKWKQLALEKGWDSEDVPKHRKNEKQQFQWGTGLLIAFALFVFWMFHEMRKTITADDEKFLGIATGLSPFSHGVSVKYESVVGIDKRKWDKKGIAKIFYKTEKGTRNSVLIDDYKYAGSEKILERCEQILAQKKSAKSEK